YTAAGPRTAGMASIGISAVAYLLPGEPVDLATLADRRLLESPPPILSEFGFRHAHVSDVPADALALGALERLIAQERLDPESIDALFVAGAIPSSHQASGEPSPLGRFNYPAARLQYECGLLHAAAIGVSQVG